MNKLLFVLLAICLVSVHAFVKREAPQAAASNANTIETVKQQLTDLTNDIQKKLSETLDPEALKKNFNELVDTINQAAQTLQPKPAQ